MKKFILLIFCSVTFTPLFAINPVRGLHKLNPALFKTPLDAAITRQTFAQLQNAEALARFSQAEQALLLTHKFIAQYKRWPRTVITQRGKIVSPENYTTLQQQETNLGRLLRRTLENNPNTPPRIKQELENLKAFYASRRNHTVMLEYLNSWLSTHPWPREKIKHPGRNLTEIEYFEMELATYANKILTRSTSIPPELLEQLRYIRAYYDSSYMPVTCKKAQENPITKEESIGQSFTDDFYISALPPTQPYDFYISSTLPRNPATARQQILPIAQDEETSTFSFQLQSIKNIIGRFINFLAENNRWPADLSAEKSIGKHTVQDIQEALLYQDILHLQQAHPGLVNYIYTAWKDKHTELLNPWTDRQYSPERLYEIVSNTEFAPQNQSPEHLTSPLEKWPSGNTWFDAEDVKKELIPWVKQHHRWPTLLTWAPPYTYDMYEEIILATNIKRYVQRRAPYSYRKMPDVDALLSSSNTYIDPGLEALRQLYQEVHAK